VKLLEELESPSTPRASARFTLAVFAALYRRGSVSTVEDVTADLKQFLSVHELPPRSGPDRVLGFLPWSLSHDDSGRQPTARSRRGWQGEEFRLTASRLRQLARASGEQVQLRQRHRFT
jgi:hypothetical protein